ncbi:glycosyltransferase [uncultured Azonexus sp.]|uniref:glycosyltransferase n=1 Tax=uncultured Azonexus sp. TaxID=520307 RepID=UPI002630DC50|nr:glycosyltransferase [uncultured Azonexus sp.]
MAEKIIVNHVMSQEVRSGIFESIISYFKKFSPGNITHVQSKDPIDEADIWHYHRPHLERRLKANSVVTVHHDLMDSDGWLNYESFHPRYSEAKKIICLNSLQKNYLQKQGLLETVIVPHGYNPEVFSGAQQKQIKSKYNILVTSRRYGRRVKGEAYFIELLQWLDNSKFSFTLVGQDRSIDRYYLKKFGFECKTYERLPYRIYRHLYDSADFLLMASLHEGGPANIPEAVASATPIICNPVGMAYDMVQDDFNGIILSMSPKRDAEKINSNAGDNVWIERIFRNCFSESKLSRAITWKESVLRNCEIYEEFLK